MTASAFAPPQQWLFTEEDREKYSKRFWRCPTRLVAGGQWAALWREDGTRRGGGVVPSVLPVLALHTWPGKQYLGEGPAADAPASARDRATWATWHYLSHRRVARLAGVNTETVGKVLDRLETAGLLQRRKLPPPKYVGGPARYEYRLTAALYAAGTGLGARALERYAGVNATLFYGGVWHLLPTAAARHLYVTIACLDPVLNEPAMLDYLEDEEFIDRSDPGVLRGIRERSPRSVAELAELSGMTRSTVEEALEVLTTPLYWVDSSKKDGAKDLPLVVTGPAAGAPGKNGVRWFAPDRAAAGWFWSPAVLNDRVERDRVQKEFWPKLAQRRAAQQGRANEKRARQARAGKFRQAIEAGARRAASGRRRAL